MGDSLKGRLLGLPLLGDGWGWIRRWQLHRDYVKRREHYARLSQERGLAYQEADSVAEVRARLVRRGYSPKPRKPGEIHTFAFLPDIGWHRHLLPDLKLLGPVTVFDYQALGFRWQEFVRADRRGVARRRAMNEMVLPALRAAAAEWPVDWVFVYASGVEISAATIQQITEELGLPTVNMCLDDKQSWAGRWMGDHRGGQIDIAKYFDVSWTSARMACEWYLSEGARPIYMPEGFDSRTYRPMPLARDLPVSFIGGAYGYRPGVVRYLQRHGVPVRTFGPGWGTESVWGDEAVAIMNRSVINLGMGGIGYMEHLTNVKTRDFEVPGVGGGVYLTSFNPDLAQHFVIGQEILCYRTRDEMLELIRYYLARPEEARAIADAGYARCRAEHRWVHRYQRVCEILGILGEAEARPRSTAWSSHAGGPRS